MIFLCLAPSEAECVVNAAATINLLTNLGFFINPSKTDLTPRTSVEFLGIRYNSLSMSLELPEAKQFEVQTRIAQVLAASSLTIRQWASLVGLLNFCCTALTYGRTHIKSLEKERIRALSLHGGDFDAKFELNSSVHSDLLWWNDNVVGATAPIRKLVFSLEFSSDASPSGWGSYCQGRSTRGFWTDTEKTYHINVLELRAARFALMCWTKDLSNAEILIRMDNSTAIAYINKMGGQHSPQLNDEAQHFWHFCEAKRLWVFASYIKSSDNVAADRASRVTNVDTEWELNPTQTAKVQHLFGKPSVDLFASRCNRKCPQYFSWFPDPEAIEVDAFTQSWSSLGLLWAFPPFALLLRTLQKIVRDRAEAIVIAPLWPTQPWFPLYHHLRQSDVLYLNPSSTLLLLPDRTHRHPMAGKLTLMAAKLSGRKTCVSSPLRPQ